MPQIVAVCPTPILEMSVPKITAEQRSLLKRCEQAVGYEFQDKSLLHAALTHASGAADRLKSNERLEFLGDSILGFIVCELLYQRFPDLLEGDLTQIKSAAVSRATCAKLGAQIGLTDFLQIGKGMDSQKGLPKSLVSNAFESLIAALYLDGGLTVARNFIIDHMTNVIEAIISGKAERNFKSALQQLAQRKFGTPPSYHLLDEAGPDHKKAFKICAQVNRNRYTPAWGNNKKQAEQRAAGNALAELEGLHPPFPEPN